MKIKRALLSVYDKTGIVEFAKKLVELQIEILSTGGTAELLKQHHLPVVQVSEHTGFPEIMNGRVKTLHPKIHGGILARRGIDDEVLQSQKIPTIDLVVVNLYPFQEVIQQSHCDMATAIENIDIGGPTMIRAAAKNHAFVSVVVNHEDYTNVIEEISTQGEVSEVMRLALARKAFMHTAQYEAAIANYFHQDGLPELFIKPFYKKQGLRYGENPHQHAAFYVEQPEKPGTVAAAKQSQGKALSYNNIADADAALECVKNFKGQHACVIVKHANPCGVAIANTQLEAYERAFLTDPTSSFGGIIAFNQPLQSEAAKRIISQQFVEVIIAPSCEHAAKQLLAEKKNVRVLECGEWSSESAFYNLKRINGGLLVQDDDNALITISDLKVVTKRQPTENEIQDLLFAWKVVKCVKSNAIVYAKENATIAIGAGQMSRVYSAKIANIKASDEGLTVAGSVMASDAFFPFRDGIDAAAKVGISAVIQPGGSIRDDEVIAAADEAGIAMVFTGVRHFLH